MEVCIAHRIRNDGFSLLPRNDRGQQVAMRKSWHDSSCIPAKMALTINILDILGTRQRASPVVSLSAFIGK